MSAVLAPRDDPEAGTWDTAPFVEPALTDLVELLMSCQGYPRARPGRAFPPRQINLCDILCECDQAELAEAVLAHVADPLCHPSLESRLEKIVSNYLRDTEWHTRRIEELHEESQEGDE